MMIYDDGDGDGVLLLLLSTSTNPVAAHSAFPISAGRPSRYIICHVECEAVWTRLKDSHVEGGRKVCSHVEEDMKTRLPRAR